LDLVWNIARSLAHHRDQWLVDVVELFFILFGYLREKKIVAGSARLFLLISLIRDSIVSIFS
jgi:hypothetical protein